MIQGFSALRMSDFMRVCADHGKRFTIPYAREKQPSLQIKIDDRKDHIAAPVNSKTEDEFADMLQKKCDLQFQSKIRSGSIVVFRMQPAASTTSEQMEDLLASNCVLNVEVSPGVLNISYIIPRAWPLSLKQLKQRHPEKFNAAGKRRGKSGSIFRRF